MYLQAKEIDCPMNHFGNMFVKWTYHNGFALAHHRRTSVDSCNNKKVTVLIMLNFLQNYGLKHMMQDIADS